MGLVSRSSPEPELCGVVISPVKGAIMDTPTERRNFKLFGEAHPNAKLTRAQVIEIRREAKIEGTSRAWLARRYGCSRSCIDRVVLGETWREAL
jgi:hypothetical protein